MDNKGNINSDDSFEIEECIDEVDFKRLNTPKKSKYRMRAHCNPLAEISITYPLNPKIIDWSLHYPLIFGKSSKENSEIYNNTAKYPINYAISTEPEATSNIPIDYNLTKRVNILDVGCGYGGLLFNMSPNLSNDDIALGMEIRDKVSHFVADKIKTFRVNTNHTKYNNIAILRTNTMKLLLNYFYKEQLEKIFFCFPDPHFKKYNHRRRIINKYLLNDYAYVLKFGGRLYTITDVEELNRWHVKTLSSHPCFKRLKEDEIKDDRFLEYMKNTDEALKVKKKNGPMYWAVYERIKPNISSINELMDIMNVEIDENDI